MNKHYFHRVSELTSTKFWINNVTIEEANLAIKEGAVGCTQNPAYVWKLISNEEAKTHVNALIKQFKETCRNRDEVMLYVQRALVEEVAEVFKPLFDESNGEKGYVSIQGDPFHEDCDTIIQSALFNCEHYPNMMAKIPVTPDGLKAIEYLAKKGIPINATEVMSVAQAVDVCHAYEKVTKGLHQKAPIYISHITGIFDEYLHGIVKEKGIQINPDILWQAGIIAAKKTYSMCKAINSEVGFIGGGARGLHHFIEMVGADASITINWKGTADELLKLNPPVVERFHLRPQDYIIDELCAKLEDFRKSYFIHEINQNEYEEFGPVVLFRSSFESAWDKSLQYIE